MCEQDQVKHFANELDKLVVRTEYDLSYAAVVGALTMKAHLLMDEAQDQLEQN